MIHAHLLLLAFTTAAVIRGRVCRPQLKAMCRGAEKAPLVGGLFGRVLEIVEGIQKYYVYTSGS